MEQKNFLLLLIIRFSILICIGILTLAYTPLIHSFPYIDKLAMSDLPQWIYAWGNFDGVHYVGIAWQGYHEFDQAFFPLYPLLIKFVSTFGLSYVASGLLISHGFFVVGVLMFYSLCVELFTKNTAYWATLLLIAFPTSFFFTALYSESLYLFLTVATMRAMIAQKYILSGMLGCLLALTRVPGLTIAIVLFGMTVVEVKKIPQILAKTWIVYAGLASGILAYMIYLFFTTGDALNFLHSQDSFNVGRSSDFVSLPQVYYRYFKIFITADRNFQYFVALIECIFATVILTCSSLHGYLSWRHKNWKELSIALFSLLTVVIPSLTGTFGSIPRYGLFAFSLYILFARIQSSKVKIIILICSAIVQMLFVYYFIQGKFIA